MQKKINSWLITQVDKGTQTDYLELDSGEFLSNEIINLFNDSIKCSPFAMPQKAIL